MILRNKIFKYCSLLLVTASLSQLICAQDSAKKSFHAWWQESYPAPSAKNPKSKLLPLIHVYKNKFVNAKGDTILLRGLSISDPDKLEHQGHWNKNHFEKQ